jgi:hypothetical protein
MPYYWCVWRDPEDKMEMQVEAGDAASAVRIFQDSNGGMRPDTIDGRSVEAYCLACERPIFAGEYRNDVRCVTRDGVDRGHEGWTCLECLVGHAERGVG